jgi:hypothetical protein
VIFGGRCQYKTKIGLSPWEIRNGGEISSGHPSPGKTWENPQVLVIDQLI